MNNCPICNSECTLNIQAQDEYGTIREWFCTNCAWSESEEIENSEYEP